MKKDWKYRWYRRINTRQERIANSEYRDEGRRIKWGRPKRSPWRLDPWNDEPRHTKQKSWKKKRKKQYYVDGRGKPYKTTFYDRVDLWNFKEECERLGIPYKVEHKAIRRRKVWYQYEKRVFWGYENIFLNHILYKRAIFKVEKIDPPLRHVTYYCEKQWWICTHWRHY
jgi:hypothetical protein